MHDILPTGWLQFLLAWTDILQLMTNKTMGTKNEWPCTRSSSGFFRSAKPLPQSRRQMPQNLFWKSCYVKNLFRNTLLLLSQKSLKDYNSSSREAFLLVTSKYSSLPPGTSPALSFPFITKTFSTSGTGRWKCINTMLSTSCIVWLHMGDRMRNKQLQNITG